MSVLFSLTLVFQFFRELLVRLLAFCPVTHRAAALPTASFDSSVRKVLCNPHQAAMDVKSPQSLCYTGLVDFTELQYINIWWSWRELNPRPKFLHPRYYMLSQSLHSPGTCGRTRHYQTSLIRFNASTPGRVSAQSLLGLTSLDPRPKSGG